MPESNQHSIAPFYGPVMVDIEGTQLSPIEIEILKHPMVGLVILFSRNLESPQQLKNLIKTIREINPKIIFGVDQEGGNVQRLPFLRKDFRCWPAAQVYGDVYDLDPTVGLQLAEDYGRGIGNELADYGIDINLAPVLDLHTKNSQVIGRLGRGFHSDALITAQLGTAFIKGLQAAGISAVAKHFPGHAVSGDDSHTQGITSGISFDELEQTHLLPFIRVIQETQVKAVMPAHITFSTVDQENSVAFSRKWLQEILRGKYNFQGAVISDCLSMKGAGIGHMTERAQKALSPGCCDVIIICNQPRELVKTVLNELVDSYQQTPESQKRIASLTRTKTAPSKELPIDIVAAALGLFAYQYSRTHPRSPTFSPKPSLPRSKLHTKTHFSPMRPHYGRFYPQPLRTIATSLGKALRHFKF